MLAGSHDVMMSLQLLLRDFSYHNIEMTCVLLEHCGRYLYRSPDSHPRAKTLLVRTHIKLTCCVYCCCLGNTVFKRDKQHLDG